MKYLILGLSFFALAAGASEKSIAVEDIMKLVDIRQIEVGGEIGHRIDMTINNNLLVLDVNRDFLRPFQDKNLRVSYIGMGKLIDATVHFAYISADERVVKVN